jgi:CBS domain-containing protein
MLRLQDIMSRDLVTFSPELSLRDAMDVLTSRHITGAPVVAADKVVGVVSLTDLAEFAAATPGVPTEHPEVPEWGEFNDPIDWIEGEEPPATFFMHMWEDASADVVERIASTQGPGWNALEEHTVSEAMNRNVISLPPDAPVELAADMMRRLGIHRVLVMDGDALVGVVTTTDVSHAVADHHLTKRVYVFGAPAARRGA